MAQKKLFERMCINDVVVSRTVRTSGKVLPDSSATVIFSGKATGLYPIDPDTKTRMQIDSPFETMRCFISDIAPGLIKNDDLFLVNSVTYIIKAVGGWNGRRGTFQEVFLEKDKA